MDLSNQLAGFLEKIVLKINKICEYYIYVEDYVAFIQYNFLLDYWKKKLGQFYHDFIPNEWMFEVILKLDGKCDQIKSKFSIFVFILVFHIM